MQTKKLSRAAAISSALGAVLFVAECSYGVGGIPNSGDLWSELRNNGPAGWAALKKAASQLEGSALQTSKSLTGARPDRQTETRFKLNGESLLFDITKIGPAGERANVSVGARNSNYSFSLGKAPDEEEWQLEAVGSSQPSNPYLRAKRVGFLRFLEMPWTLLDVPLADILSSKSFKKIDARREAGSQLIEYTFSFDFPVDHRNPVGGETIHGSFVSDRATIRLDPSRHWLMQSYHVHGQFKTIASLSGSFEGELQFQDIGQAAPIIKRVVSRKMAENLDEGSEIVFEITDVNVRKIPEGEFKLIAYGFPEVGSVEELYAKVPENRVEIASQNNRIWWIVVNVALVGLVAFFLARKKYRRAMMS